MTPETKTILHDLQKASLFSSVGEQVDDENTIVVKSWKEALTYSKRVDWQNLKLHWGNGLTGELSAHYPERFQVWNDIVRELKAELLPIIEDKVQALNLDDQFTRQLRDSVNWDFLSLLLESEYSDLVTPHYYAALGVIYFDGHFPCGWEGEYPAGKLVVY